MSSIYTSRPTYQDLGGSIVLLSIVKRFPTFLQCEALFFAAEADSNHAQVAPSPLEFRDAVASLPVNAILGPVSGGVPLILYVSKPGFEDDFKEVACDIAVSGYDLVRAAPDASNPFFLVFGKPAELPAADQRLPCVAAPALPPTLLAPPLTPVSPLAFETPRETAAAASPDEPLIAVPHLPETAPQVEGASAAQVQAAVETPPTPVSMVAGGEQPEQASVMPEALIARPEAPEAAVAATANVVPERSSDMTPEAAPSPTEQAERGPRHISSPDGFGSNVLPVAASPLSGETRRSDFDRTLRSIRTLTAEGKPEALATALQLYDRAAVDYGDLWGQANDTERVVVADSLARFKLGEAKKALAAGQWATAISALAQAVTCPATYGEALGLQAALWAYLRGEVEKTQGDHAAASASFAYAAAHCAELRERSGALAQELAQTAKQQAAQSGQEIKQLLAGQQAALLAAVDTKLTQMQEQAANRQVMVARQAQDEQTERQLTALRHLQQEQATQLQALLVKLQNEQSEWQQETFKTLEREKLAQQQTQVERPAWFAAGVKELGRAVAEQGEALQAPLRAQQDQIIALQKTISEWRSQKSARVDEPVIGPELGAAVNDLAWKVETSGRTVKGISTGLGVLFILNVLLLAALAIGFIWSTSFYGATLAALRPVPAPTYGPLETQMPPLAVLPEPTVALTGVALKCADTNRGRVYYECTLGNGVAYPQTLSLAIAADGGQAHGFFPSVALGDKQIFPDPTTTLASLGRFEVGQLKRFRLNLPCAAALGCEPTTFVVRVVDSQASVVPGSEILITSASPAP